MCAVRQHAQRDVLEALPFLEDIRQDVIAYFINIAFVNMADHFQMRGVDDHFSAERDRRLQFIHGLGSCPQFIVHGRGAGKNPMKGFITPVDVLLRGEIGSQTPCLEQVSDEHPAQFMPFDHQRRQRHRRL